MLRGQGNSGARMGDNGAPSAARDYHDPIVNAAADVVSAIGGVLVVEVILNEVKNLSLLTLFYSLSY
ncbi:hypothetical protein KQI52_12365 [bacterium]|nr:hypothetical protein [bacterium]